MLERNDGHLSAGDLSGLLDGDLPPEARQRVEAHLDACDSCRRELVAVRRLADSWRPAGSRPRRLWIGGGLALAAGLAAVLLLPGSRGPSDAGRAVVRGPEPGDGREDRATIVATEPPAGAAIVTSTIVFAWHPAAADVYRLTLLSESGEPVWSAETADTTVTLPAAVSLGPGAYFWRVDAVADGITATTGVRRLRIER